MSVPEDKLKGIQDELKWVTVKDEFVGQNKPTEKGIYGFLVPGGCLITVGVLASGLYSMIKKDSKKQQLLMRYRVLAQGVTIAIASIGLFHMKSSG